jgi:hypothetical protein
MIRPSSRLERFLWFALLLGLCASPAWADRASGTTTGLLELRGDYYWETSTRVLAPSVSLRLDLPNGLSLDAEYVLDSVTSASVAAGALTDTGFTERRNDLGLGASYEFGVGDAQLLLSLHGTFSKEPDYRSRSGSLGAALSLNDRATVLRLNLGYLHDDVGQRFRTGTGARPDPTGGVAGRFSEKLEAFTLGAGWDQALTPTLTTTLSYDFGRVSGFLASPYRRLLLGDGTRRPENHPSLRLRHTLAGRLAWYVRPTHSAIHLLYRAYVDSWHVAAITPEVRLYQELGAHRTLRLRYRYYVQNRASFYKEPDQYQLDDVLISIDPKMSRFHSQLLGVKMMLDLEFLEHSFLRSFAAATVDMSFEYIWNTNRYGNGVIASVTMRVPF